MCTKPTKQTKGKYLLIRGVSKRFRRTASCTPKTLHFVTFQNHNFCQLVDLNLEHPTSKASYIDHDSLYPSSSILVLGAWQHSGATDWREECIRGNYIFPGPLSQILGIHLRHLGVYRLSLHESPSEQQSKRRGE
jgi:hypothetical protein